MLTVSQLGGEQERARERGCDGEGTEGERHRYHYVKTPYSNPVAVSTYKSTWHYNPEDQYLHFPNCENLKHHIVPLLFTLKFCQLH
jgi:hypothetical protein